MASDNGIIIPFIADASQLLGPIQDSINRLTELQGVTKDTLTQWTNAQKQMADATSDTVDATKNLGDSFKQLHQNIAGGALNDAAKNLKAFGDASASTTELLAALSRQIDANQKQLKALADEGNKAGAAYKQLEQDTARLTGALNNITKTITGAGMALKTLKAGKEGLDAVKSGLDAASKASELFGTKNEALAQTIDKMGKVIAIVNDVISVGNAIKEVAVALTVSETAATEGATVAATLFGEASAAAWAAATGGISLVVTAIAGLIYWLTSSKDATDDYKNAVDWIFHSN